MNAWPLRWSHGSGFVEAVGAMLGPVEFRLPDGRGVQPFAVFPWADEPLPADEQALQGLMARGRGEWPCVPFGLGPGAGAETLGWDHPIHGDAAHAAWQRVDDGRDASRIDLRFDAPQTGPLESLERSVRGVDGRAQVECRLVVRVRADCRLPIGLHPTLRLPARPGAMRIEPGSFRFALGHPGEVEPGADVLAPAQEFQSLAAAPRRGGGELDLSHLPLAGNTESLAQLCAIDGRVAATNLDEGWRFELGWDAAVLPSCLLWVSNAGRRDWPWSRRHYALGIEPVCTYFDQGVVACAAENALSRRGVATSVALQPGVPLQIDYRMAVTPIHPLAPT
ncbi:MAG: hypothetical protein KGL43_27795 [Burkholderiales bacterium]|nr:hypothetical protein [Burkholderiales bacterium]